MWKYIIAFVAICVITGCSESTFSLSPESRLPKWLAIPEGERPQDYTVTLSYYVWPSGREAVFKLKKKDSWWSAKEVKGKLRGLEPLMLKSSSAGGYPSYEVITISGVTDIVEHRKMEPIFYMVDDPVVWSKLEVQK